MTGEGPAKKEGLKDVFRMNHEMGRIAREFPALAPRLREMQLEVNSMTIQIKRDEWEGARVAFAGSAPVCRRSGKPRRHPRRARPTALRRN